MNFKAELVKELGLGVIAEATMLEDYVKACEAIAVKYHESEVKKIHIQNVNTSFLPKCTRVEVIDKSGRTYVNWKPTNKVQTQMQDDNKTLKVFIT